MNLQDIFFEQVYFPQDHRVPQKDILIQHSQLINIKHDLLSLHENDAILAHTDLNKESTEQSGQEFIKLSKPQKEKKKRIRKYVSNNPNNKKGHWTKEQSLKYHYFLEINANYFIDKQKRKTDKIFKSMSFFIETREPHQCRSHHQKIQKKWGSFPNILLNLRIQNFRTTDIKPVTSSIQKLGIHNPQIYSEQDLHDQQRIINKIRSQGQKIHQCHEKNNSQEFDASSDLSQAYHNRNCMCLMMSQKYEDQLAI